MAIPRVADVDALPEIGSRYRVHSLLVGRGPRVGMRWVPVYGSRHQDPEIDVGFTHYHYDLRFVSATLWGWLFHAAWPVGDGMALGKIEMVAEVSRTSERVWVCRRQMPFFPGRLPGARGLNLTTERLQMLYRRHRVAPGCRVCPHRGLPLAGLPVDAAGCVVCPGHGLKWNLDTGKMVPR